MDNLPKIGIIVATHDYAHYINDCIISALYQDWPNKELWIVDDCSTDNTEEVVNNRAWEEIYLGEPRLQFRANEVEKYTVQQAQGTKVHYLKLKQNGGPSRARNVAILNALSTGSHLIKILDADDILKPNNLSELAAPILMNPEEVAGTYANYTIFDVDKKTYTFENKESYSWERLCQDCIIHSGCLFNGLYLKKVAFQRQGRDYVEFYDEDLKVAEDYNLHLRCAKTGIYIHLALDLTLVRNHSKNSLSWADQETWKNNYQLAKARAFQ